MKKNNDADIQSGFSSDDDELLNFTPNDNDELVIETVSSTEQQNPTETPTIEVEKPSAEPTEKATETVEPVVEKIVEEVVEPEIEVKPDNSVQEVAEQETEIDEELDNQTDEEYNQNDEEMEKKRAKRIIIVLIAIIALLLLLLGGCVWLYFSKVKPLLEQPPVEVVKDTTPAPVVDTVPKIVEEVIDTTPVDTVVPAPKVYYPEKRIAGKNKVPTSGWLIGYRATPNEAEAIKTVAELSYVDSIPCGYYWINDARKGKKLFKVYVGPYKTQAEVEAIFPTIKARVADAHIYSEDAQLLELYRQQKQVYTAE